MPVPRAIGNARRIEKRALGAHQREIERGGGIAVRRRIVLHERIGHLSRAIGGACEAVDRGRQRRERRTVRRLGAVCRLGDELADARCGGAIVERQHVGVREPQRHHAPHACHRRVALEARVAELRHPQMVVVHRVVDAVRTGVRQIGDRHAEKVQKDGVVRSAAEPVGDQLRLVLFDSQDVARALKRGLVAET